MSSRKKVQVNSETANPFQVFISFLKEYGGYLILALFIILGFVIRSEGIFNNHVVFLFDNARDYLYVKNIVIDHRIYLIGPSSGGLQGYFHGVLWYYLLTIPFILSHGNPLSGTIFMIIGSLASVVVTFILMRKISNTYVALLASLFFAVTFFSVATARFIWNPYPIVWLMPVYFYFVYKYFSEKSGFIWIALISGLFLHFEAVFGVPMLFPFFILTAIEIYRKRVKQLLLGLLLFVLPMVPSLIFDLRHHLLIIGSIAKTFLTGGSTITHDNHAVPVATRFILRSQDLFTYTIGSLTTNNLVNILLTLVALFSIKQQKRSFILFSIFVLITPFILFLFMKYAVWSYYWIGETPYFILLISLLIGTLPKKTLAVIAIVVVFLFSGYFADLQLHKNGYADEGSQTLSTELRVVDSIHKDAQQQPFSFYVLTPAVYDYVYRYMYWWRGNTVYHYYPQQQKQHLAYLVIDPNPDDPEGNFFINHTLHMQTKPIKQWTIAGVKIDKFITKENEEQADVNLFPPEY